MPPKKDVPKKGRTITRRPGVMRNNLYIKRLKADKTQKALCKEMVAKGYKRYTQPYYSDIENGNNVPETFEEASELCSLVYSVVGEMWSKPQLEFLVKEGIW